MGGGGWAEALREREQGRGNEKLSFSSLFFFLTFLHFGSTV